MNKTLWVWVLSLATSEVFAGVTDGGMKIDESPYSPLPRAVYKNSFEQRAHGLLLTLTGEPASGLPTLLAGGSDQDGFLSLNGYVNEDVAVCVIASSPIAKEYLSGISLKKVKGRSIPLPLSQENSAEHYKVIDFPEAAQLNGDLVGFRIQNMKSPEKKFDIVCDLSRSFSKTKHPRSHALRYGFALHEMQLLLGPYGAEFQADERIEKDYSFFLDHRFESESKQGPLEKH